MSVTDDHLLAVLWIGNETSMRGEGISMREALLRTEYGELRKELGASDLVPVLQAHPELIEQ